MPLTRLLIRYKLMSQAAEKRLRRSDELLTASHTLILRSQTTVNRSHRLCHRQVTEPGVHAAAQVKVLEEGLVRRHFS
jgi:hypothetical protein